MAYLKRFIGKKFRKDKFGENSFMIVYDKHIIPGTKGYLGGINYNNDTEIDANILGEEAFSEDHFECEEWVRLFALLQDNKISYEAKIGILRWFA
jgi:hypothetical protein